jgi:hypothetical protein
MLPVMDNWTSVTLMFKYHSSVSTYKWIINIQSVYVFGTLCNISEFNVTMSSLGNSVESVKKAIEFSAPKDFLNLFWITLYLIRITLYWSRLYFLYVFMVCPANWRNETVKGNVNTKFKWNRSSTYKDEHADVLSYRSYVPNVRQLCIFFFKQRIHIKSHLAYQHYLTCSLQRADWSIPYTSNFIGTMAGQSKREAIIIC